MQQRKLAVLLGITFVLLLSAAVVVGLFSFQQPVSREQPQVLLSVQPENVKASAIDAFAQWKKAEAPLQKTGIDGIFYAITKNGDVSFYSKEGTSFSKLRADGKYDITVSCSREEIPVQITYIEKDGKTEGYGLFVNRDADASVHYYDYIFFRLCTPTGLLAKDGQLLLLLDYEEDRLYRKKQYGDSFYFNPATKETEPVFSQAQRGFDKQARLRTDYAVLTDSILVQTQAPFLFLSGRFHAVDSGKTDLYAMGKQDEYNTDNNRYKTNVLGNLFYIINGKVTFWQEKEQTNGFVLTDADGTVLQSYDGDFDADYILCDNLLLQKGNGQIYDALTGQTYVIPLAVACDAIALYQSEDSRYVAVVTKDAANGAAVCFYDTLQNISYVSADPVWMQTVTVLVGNDGTFTVCVAYSGDAQTVRHYTYSF